MEKYNYDFIADQEPDGNSEWYPAKEVDKENEQLKKEKEELQEDLRSTVGGRSAAGLALAGQNMKLIEDNKRLKKEKKWLIERLATRTKGGMMKAGIKNNNLYLILLWIIDKIVLLALFLIFNKVI